MSALDLVIRGGSVVTATDVMRCDVGVKDGRVVMLGADLPAARDGGRCDRPARACPAASTATATSSSRPARLPQMCDTFTTGTSSAAAGGTTTVVCFAWQMKGQSLAKAARRLSGGGAQVARSTMRSISPSPIRPRR